MRIGAVQFGMARVCGIEQRDIVAHSSVLQMSGRESSAAVDDHRRRRSPTYIAVQTPIGCQLGARLPLYHDAHTVFAPAKAGAKVTVKAIVVVPPELVTDTPDVGTLH